MPPTPSLVDLPLGEAIDAVAKRAADRRTRPPTYAEKVALEASNVLSSVGDFLNKNDAARGAVLGTGAGALAGAGSALLGPGSWKDKRRRLGGSMLTGGLAGATLGGGLGAARQFGRGLAPTAGPSGEGGRGAAFTDPDTGHQMRIDPSVLKARPELAARVQQLSTPGVEQRVSDALGTGIGTAATYAPATTAMGTALGGRSFYNALRGAGREHTLDNLRAGLAAKDVGRSVRGGQQTLDAIRGMSEADQSAMLARARGPGLLGRLRGQRPDGVAAAVPSVSHLGDRAVGSLHHIGTDEVKHIVGSGHTARRAAAGKLPAVSGRNAALMTGAGLVDLGRHMYLGQRDEAEQRRQLRELMGQVARETANRGR